MSTSCSANIQRGMLFRLLVTGVTLMLVPGRNRFLVVPIVLTLLDFMDNIYTFNNGCAHTFDYQFRDKLVDVASYLLVPLDSTVFGLTIFRFIGVLLFGSTGQSYWLVLFFDFVKEYMLYSYFFSTPVYLPVVVALKIMFEAWHHFNHSFKQ